jgi:hypothetical protein
VLVGEVGLAYRDGYIRARRLAGARRVSQSYRLWPLFPCRAKHHDISLKQQFRPVVAKLNVTLHAKVEELSVRNVGRKSVACEDFCLVDFEMLGLLLRR